MVIIEEISSDKMFPGIILRNNYIYIIFIFFLLTNKEIIKNNINLLFIFSILSFFINHFSYFSERNEIVKNFNYKNSIFYEVIDKYKKNNYDKLLVYSDVGYGFENLVF